MSLFSLASDLVSAGFSVVPIRPDGSKAPALPSWDIYKTRKPVGNELANWFDTEEPSGLAIIAGAVSDNLAIVDIEYADYWEKWSALVEAECPGLLELLPVVKTPGHDENGGRHVYFRSLSPLKTGKLARLTREEAEQRTGDIGKTTAIEIKAEGGYALTVGCAPACHPTGRTYEHISGAPITETPVLEEEHVGILLTCARALDRPAFHEIDEGAPEIATLPAVSGKAGLRPGDQFNREANWSDILEPHRWVMVRDGNGVKYWRRPGKNRGISATTGYCTSERSGDLLFVFSTNAAPFQDGRAYSRFAAYARLNHDADWKKAARELGKQGYGEPAKGKGKRKPVIIPDEPPADNEIETQDELQKPDTPIAPESPVEFPIQSFPAVLAQYAREIARSLSCAVDFPAVLMLATAATAIGATRAIAVSRSWVEGPRLYLAIVADPGDAKSPAMDAICRPIYDLQNHHMADWTADKKQYDADMDEYESAKRRKGAAIPVRPQAPTFRHLYTTNATTECLVPILRDNPRGVAMLMDEVTAWILAMNQYKGGKGNDRQFWLSAWSGAPGKVDRKGTAAEVGSIIVPHPFINVFGGIQPDMLVELCDEKKREDGFIHRLLFSYPSPCPWSERIPPSPSMELETAWKDVIEWMYSNLQMHLEADELPRPYVVRPTEEAMAVLERWYVEHSREKNHQDFPYQMVGPWSKMRSYYFRICLIVHCLRRACGETAEEDVDAQDCISAASIIEYFKSHARRVYRQLQNTSEDKRVDQAIAWIKAHGGSATAKVFLTCHVCGVKKQSEAKELLDDLVDRQFATVAKSQGKRGRSVDVYTVIGSQK